MTKQGRPTKYNPDTDYVALALEFIEMHQDSERQLLKQSNSSKGYDMFENKLDVKLPTVEGFAAFLEVNKTTLYEWEKAYPIFSNALSIIRREQKERLMNKGLSGDYNSTIAKLILSSNHGMAEKSESKSEVTVKPLLGGESVK